MHAAFHHRHEARKPLRCRGPDAAVSHDVANLIGGLAVFVEHRRIDLDDLGAEAIFIPRPGGVVLAAQAEGVAFFPADAPLLGHELGALELRGVLVVLLVAGGRGALTLLVA